MNEGMNNLILLPVNEAGARTAPPIPQNAAEGLQVYTERDGSKWAWNPLNDEWQRIHEVQRGGIITKAGLFGLSGYYYGTSSVEGARLIYGVPQNQAIQGDDINTGLIPGDLILIPGLKAPGAPPAIASVPLEPVPQTPQEVVAGTEATVPGVGAPAVVPQLPDLTDAPAGWPAGLPYPPQVVPPTEPPVVPVSLPSPVTTVPVSARPGAPVVAGETFWTPGRTVAVAVVGALGIGGIIYFATRRKGRRGRRRRRAA